jgi:hypothetical protein
LLLAGLLLLLLLGLEGLAAHVVVLLPVLVLAEGAAVARCVAAAARLAGLTTAVPAALEDQRRGSSSKCVDVPKKSKILCKVVEIIYWCCFYCEFVLS